MSRRRAREIALQVLYQVDLGRSDPDTALFQAFSRELEGEEPQETLNERDGRFARDLVLGTWERREEIDGFIVQYAKDWPLERMAGVDRNILRMAIYEIRHQEDIPPGVTADEAVELAKTYSTSESSRFVNGILGSLIRGMNQEAPGAQADVSS